MAKTLFYSVGNSDVVINGYSRFPNFYETTKELSRLFNKELEICQGRNSKIKRNRQGYDFQFVEDEIKIKEVSEKVKTIEFPLFAPLMEKLKGEGIDKLYLFVTKQEVTEQKLPHHQDTKYAGSLIKAYATEKYKIANVEPIEIKPDPSDYDLMAHFFTEFFKKKHGEVKNNIENFIAISAGTPAMITSIALNSIDLPVRYFCIMRKTPYSEAQEVEIFHKINLERYIAIIKPLIFNYEYVLASEIAENSPLKSNFQLLNLIEIMGKRISFNFEEAMGLVHACSSELKEKLTDISRLANKEQEALCLEIFSLIEINFSKKDYLTGVAFIFNLMENIRGWLFEKHTKTKIEKKDNEFKDFNDYIKNNCKLKKRLEKKELKYENSPNRRVLLEILKWINEQQPDQSLAKVLEFIERIETENKTSAHGKISLSDLRNQGPFAHGTKGVSEELLKEIYPLYGKDGIINDIKEFLLSLCNFQGDWHNPYDLINQEIIELMKEEEK